MKIENVSLREVSSGNYPEWMIPANTYLIQIQDHDTQRFVNAKNRGRFAGYSQFRFDDTDSELNGISKEDATKIADILTACAKEKLDIVVHCHAGICRSGAVVEAAVAIFGYDNPRRLRNPNLRVKKMLFEVLGFANTEKNYEDIFYGYDKKGEMIMYNKDGDSVYFNGEKCDE